MNDSNEGLPESVRAGVEQLSGVDLSDVRVHYNSDVPRQQGADAFTQGNDIHVAPGQHRLLAHEAWHVVQQRQGRVSPASPRVASHIGLNRDTQAAARERELLAKRTPL